MENLLQYLATQFHADKHEIEQVKRLSQDVVSTLLDTFDENLGWTYQVTRDGGPETMEKLSHSTTAMVTLALARLVQTPNSSLSSVTRLPFATRQDENYTAVKSKVGAALVILAKGIAKRKVATLSGTYGKDDPVTLSFIAPLCPPGRAKGKKHDKWRRIRSFASQQALRFTRQDPYRQTELWQPLDRSHRVVANAVIPLRVVRTVNSLGLSRRCDLSNYRTYFETTLHEHLSFSSIPDSRFDPAELAFCLEGLLLSQKEAVDYSLFKRVVEVLTHAQKESAFWRPNKPFLATSQGLSLFPVSVEIANSLLRSCELYDGNALYDTFASQCVPLLRRYWQWLRSRTIRFRVNGIDFVGWGSEHINELDLIHIWETSQVLDFLVAYRRLLQMHVARHTLILSRFNVKSVTLPIAPKAWLATAAEYEPVTSLGQHYRIYGRMGTDFVDGWLRNNRLNYSMLLYGPPGTGKTTVAENLAKALNVRIINISVSDFLAGGSAQMEAQAKAIFDVLNSQIGCVVLLDEIDQLLLDRDGTRYSRQGDVFQFMTPGMLTKLNDLRAAEGVIFVIATNYENRIDSAIKRAGRIDQKYLVLPPDGRARRGILTKILCATHENSAVNPKKLKPGDWQRLLNASLFLNFTDIDGATRSILHRPAIGVDKLVSALANRTRTISLARYESRFRERDEQPPEEEFLCLVAMACEDSAVLESAEPALLASAERFKDRAGGIEAAVHSIVPTLKLKLRRQIIDTLESVV